MVLGGGAIKQSIHNNTQGPDKLNIGHLTHIGPLGFAFPTSMFKPALNNNIIHHTWKCLIMLRLIDICFLTCICMWQISQIQTCLRVVVRPGLVSTLPIL